MLIQLLIIPLYITAIVILTTLLERFAFLDIKAPKKHVYSIATSWLVISIATALASGAPTPMAVIDAFITCAVVAFQVLLGYIIYFSLIKKHDKDEMNDDSEIINR